MSGFRKAERRQVKLKLGMAGPSGSGKTFSALQIAKGLLPNGGRVALIDTENKSASLYADTPGMPGFDALELDPPYTIEKYIAAINLAIQNKYDVLIVDSVSHVWSGEGGLLQEKESLDARGGNSYTNWAKMTPKWNKFVSAILHSDIHMICTMRSKQDYVLVQNDKGKQAPQKMGMAPQVREGFEYELTAVFDMDMSHQAQASKDRTNLFDGRTWKPDAKTGEEILKWLGSGKAPEVPKSPAPIVPPTSGNGAITATTPDPTSATPATMTEPVTIADRDLILQIAKQREWPLEQVQETMRLLFKKEKVVELTRSEYNQLKETLLAENAPRIDGGQEGMFEEHA